MPISNVVVKTTSVPVVIQINGVNLPSFSDIKVELGGEVYLKSTHPSVVYTNTSRQGELELILGIVTSLAVGDYPLEITLYDAKYVSGNTIVDCSRNPLSVVVRDPC